jgi:hypothetical protein
VATPLDDKIEELNDAIDLIVAQMKKVGNTSPAFAGLKTGLENARKDLKQLNVAKETGDSLSGLNEQIKSGKSDYQSMAVQLTNITDKYKRLGIEMPAATKDEIEAMKLSIGKMFVLTQALNVAGVAVSAYVSRIAADYKAVSAALSEADSQLGGFNMASELAKNSIDQTKKTVDGILDSLSLFGTLISLLPVGRLVKILGILGAGAAQLGKTFVETNAEIQKFQIDLVLNETKKLIKSYGDITRSGLLMGNGMGDLYRLSDKFGLSMKDVTKILSESGESLALIGGTVAGGAEKVGNVFKNVSLDTQDQMRKLGYSIEDQIAMTTDYVDLLARAGTLRYKSDKAIADETASYMTNLKVISSITGEDAKKARERARSAVMQTYVNARINQMGGDAMAKATESIAAFPEVMQTAIKQLAAAGFVSDKAAATVLSNAPELRRMLEGLASSLRDTSVDQTTFTKQVTDALSTYKSTIGRTEADSMALTIGYANLMKGSYSEMENFIQGLQRMGIASGKAADSIQSAPDVTNQLKNTSDALTNTISKAQTDFAAMSKSFEQSMKDVVLQFTKFTNEQMRLQVDMINKVRAAAGLGAMVTPGSLTVGPMDQITARNTARPATERRTSSARIDRDIANLRSSLNKVEATAARSPDTYMVENLKVTLDELIKRADRDKQSAADDTQIQALNALISEMQEQTSLLKQIRNAN